ncbi:MAG: hypothetical protein Q4B69_00730 [Slackia sp.]|nr:hypothetical protein [Slackia sp.]
MTTSPQTKNSLDARSSPLRRSRLVSVFMYVERIKKQHDLQTYREVLAFSRGEHVERDTIEGRRERTMRPWIKGVRTSVRILVGAAVGGASGFGLCMLAMLLA